MPDGSRSRAPAEQDRPAKKVAPPPPKARAGLPRRGGKAALELITGSLAEGDGYRHAWIGLTGVGKTFAAEKMLREPGRLVLVHDDSKRVPQFNWLRYYSSPDAFKAAPAVETDALSAVGFRGDVYAGERCEVEDVAAFGMELARGGNHITVYIDELSRAVEGERTLRSPSMLAGFEVGRQMAQSWVYSTLHPRRVPDTLWTLTSSVGFFRLEQKVLNYLDRVLCLDDEMLATIAKLERGDFVLHRPGLEWDRTIYRF